MSRLCTRCDRGSNRGNSRSHSHIATKRQQYANIQVRRVGGQKMKLCTRCIRTMSRTLAEKVAGSRA